MSKHYSRRFFLGSAAALLAGPGLADAPQRSLRPQARGAEFYKRAVSPAEEIVARAGLSGQVTYAVADVKTGLVLEERNGSTGLPPASVTKALTALYALNALGADYRFETRLIATGAMREGVLTGDLVLAGGGDPVLDTDALATLAQRLKAAGLREVRGRFLVYGGVLPAVDRIDPGQPDHVGYNPAISGLNLNYNRVHFGWKRAGSGYQVSMDARSAKFRPEVRVAAMQVARRDIPVYTYTDAGGRDQWTVASGALGQGGARWLPVRKPEIYAGEVFQTFARSQGIVLQAPQVVRSLPGGTVLARWQSGPLRAILHDMLKYSTNLTAEVVGMTATAARKGRVSGLRASAREMNAWAESTYKVQGLRLVDHSGLGSDSRVAAGAMAQVLVRARAAGLAPILKPFPMRDAKRKVIENHPVKVRAKTGTLNFVSGLGGYMTARDGTEMAFAIFAADTGRRARLSRAERERPEGARGWNRRAKALQQALIERWGQLYGS